MAQAAPWPVTAGPAARPVTRPGLLHCPPPTKRGARPRAPMYQHQRTRRLHRRAPLSLASMQNMHGHSTQSCNFETIQTIDLRNSGSGGNAHGASNTMHGGPAVVSSNTRAGQSSQKLFKYFCTQVSHLWLPRVVLRSVALPWRWNEPGFFGALGTPPRSRNPDHVMGPVLLLKVQPSSVWPNHVDDS